MEAASRPPPLELVPDLPVEEPLGSGAAAPRESVAGGSAAPARAASSHETEQTGLNFVDPELFLAAGQKPTTVPVAAATSAAVKDALAVDTLTLEDPVVDDLLTAPPRSPAAASAPAAPVAAARPPPSPMAAPGKAPPSDASARTSARVPIARTASLAAAASKVAAANAMRERAALKSTPSPTAPVGEVAAAPSRSATPAKAAAPNTATVAKSAAAVRAAPAAATPPARAATPKPATQKPGTPSPATGVSARTAAAVPRVNAAPPIPTITTLAAASSAPTAATGAAAAPAAPSAATSGAQTAVPAAAPPPMDRDFIARNQVVERYLSGRLPLKGATDFERFCHDHPELLDEIGLAERVNAGLRLLEASGKPEPWQEAVRPPWQKPQVTLALAACVAVLALTLAIVAGGSAGKTHRIAELQKQSAERALDPATSRREIRLVPSRSGASNSPAIIIGGNGPGRAQLADFKIDESRSPYRSFRVTIDRIDQGRVGIIGNLAKDSNGHLRIALNSSALGPGNYQLTLEGLDWRGEPQPDSWVTIGIVH